MLYEVITIWSKAGMEDDANWWLEAPGGLEVGGSGLSATLRDYARFGLFMLEDGVIGNERILPEGWMAEASSRQVINGETVDYGYMLWPLRITSYNVCYTKLLRAGTICPVGMAPVRRSG